MTVKLFKAIWFISLLVALAVLLFIYAGLPEHVVLREEGAKLTSLPRDAFFYTTVAIMAFINVLVFIVEKVLNKNQPFRTWFYGLVGILNVFFMVSLKLIGTFNSGEKFNYRQIDFIIYGSVCLILVWAAGWPIYALYQKISTKRTV
jgi:hypothetical protein